MANDPVVRETRRRSATLTIRRGHARNCLDLQTLKSLRSELEQLADLDSVRAVIITGEGDKAFCAGADLSLLPHLKATEPTERNAYVELLLTMLSFPKPLIARINGVALGGGLGLVLACDLAIAAEHVTVGTPEVRVGLYPFMIMPLLIHHVGPKRAAQMALTGTLASAADATAMGLLNRTVPSKDLDSAVAETVDACCNGGPNAQRCGKRAVREVSRAHLENEIDRMAVQFAKILTSDELAEGAAAFLEKRPPSWKE